MPNAVPNGDPNGAPNGLPTRVPNAAAPGLVLDTNVLLDWLLFADARLSPWVQAIEQGHVRWLVCAPTRAELARTLGYAALQKWQPEPANILARYDALAQPCQVPPALPQPALRCSDPDDQIFLDLAVAQGAKWLLTHDRALLRLARPAARLGLTVASPWRLLSEAAPLQTGV